MPKTCLTHKDTPAITMCSQCHKPICQSCTMVTPAGRYCSSECSIIHKEMTTKLRGPGGRKGSPALKAIFVLLLLVAIPLVIHLIALDKKDQPDHFLKKIDLIGRYLDQQKK